MSIEYRSIRTRHTAAETSTINDNVPLPAPAGAVAPLKTSCARTGGQTPNCSALAGSRRVQHISHCRSTRLARPHPPRVLASAPPHITHSHNECGCPLSHTHTLSRAPELQTTTRVPRFLLAVQSIHSRQRPLCRCQCVMSGAVPSSHTFSLSPCPISPVPSSSSSAYPSPPSSPWPVARVGRHENLRTHSTDHRATTSRCQEIADHATARTSQMA